MVLPEVENALGPDDGGRLLMKDRTMPSVESITAHEQAASEITELRRKGVPCHLEDHPNASGHHLRVVQDEDTQPNLPPFPSD